MTYCVFAFAIAFVVVLVNALLMQEQEQAAAVDNDNIRYHIDIASFDEWCEDHPLAGYWKPITMNTKYDFWFRTEVTDDPQTWPDYDPEVEEGGDERHPILDEELDFLILLDCMSRDFWEDVDHLLDIKYPPAEPWPYPEVEPEDLPFWD